MIETANRDVNEINSHVLVMYEDVIAEPEGVRSSGCVWYASTKCFGCCKGCIYNAFAFLCGVIMSIIWGFYFGFIAFCNVWCFTPFMRAVEINCVIQKRIVKLFLSCCLDPCCESCGLIFGAFKRG